MIMIHDNMMIMFVIIAMTIIINIVCTFVTFFRPIFIQLVEFADQLAKSHQCGGFKMFTERIASNVYTQITT